MNKKRIFHVLALALLTFTGAEAQSETMYVVHTVDGVTLVDEYTRSNIDSVVFAKPLIPYYHTCPDDAHPHIIDLGLSVKWACCNVGASKPEDFGTHFNWGKTVETEDTEYYDGLTSIQGDKEHDAATANWGSSWVTPTKEQLEELKENCNWQWIEESKIYKATSKKAGYTDAYIILPAAGFTHGVVEADPDDADYWSSTPLTGEWSNRAYYLNLQKGDYQKVTSLIRGFGASVRAVSQ